MSEMVKRVSIARFMGKPAAEVERMTEEDNLPYVRVPGRRKPGKRFFLPDFHRWLVGRCVGEMGQLRNYTEFKRAFFAAQAGPPVADEAEEEEECHAGR